MCLLADADISCADDISSVGGGRFGASDRSSTETPGHCSHADDADAGPVSMLCSNTSNVLGAVSRQGEYFCPTDLL